MFDKIEDTLKGKKICPTTQSTEVISTNGRQYFLAERGTKKITTKKPQTTTKKDKTKNNNNTAKLESLVLFLSRIKSESISKLYPKLMALQ